MLDRRYGKIELVLREQWRLVTKGDLKWRESRGRGGERFVSLFNPRQVTRPGERVV